MRHLQRATLVLTVFSLYCACVNPRDAANKILRQAESDLRDLIRAELEAKRYAAIAEIARLAEAVSALGTKSKIPTRPPHSSKQSQGGKASVEPKMTGPSVPEPKRERPKSSNVPKTPPADHYPRFELDADSITKVGWSKKSKCEYKHTASIDAAISLAEHIDGHTEQGRIWTVEGLGDISDAHGPTALPNYQIYLILAWMRDKGLVLKHGRSGYSTPNGPSLITATRELLADRSEP